MRLIINSIIFLLAYTSLAIDDYKKVYSENEYNSVFKGNNNTYSLKGLKAQGSLNKKYFYLLHLIEFKINEIKGIQNGISKGLIDKEKGLETINRANIFILSLHEEVLQVTEEINKK